MASRNARAWILGAVLLAGAGAVGRWYWIRPRVISLCIVTDEDIRRQNGWQALLESRVQRASAMYERSVGIRWTIAENREEPTDRAQDALDVRRLRLLEQPACAADVLLLITSRKEANRTASVNPFSRAALIMQNPQEPDSKNTLVLAHELAHLFGARHSPSQGTLMAEVPEGQDFDGRTAQLIWRLRKYPFASGVDGLAGSWQKRVLDALEKDISGLAPDAPARAHLVIATSLATDGRIGLAIPEFRAAVSAGPQNTDARYALAVALSGTDPDAAIRELRDGIRVNPSAANLHGLLGTLLAKKGDRDEAVNELTTAVRAQPDNARLHAMLGVMLAQQTGRIDAAIEAFREAARLDPQMPAIRENLDKALLFKQQLDAEVARQESIARKNPGNSNAHYNVGVAKERAGDFPGAVSEFEKAIQLNPKHGEAHASLAVALYLTGDYPGAWREVQLASDAGVAVAPTFLETLRRTAPR